MNNIVDILKICYPWCCRLCHAPVASQSYLCKQCQIPFHFLACEGRCRQCFSISREPYCLLCFNNKRPQKIAFCWQRNKSVQRFVQQAQKGRLASLFADVLMVQHERLKWQIPDRILSIPNGGQKGYIKKLARQLKVPYSSPLIRYPFGSKKMFLNCIGYKQLAHKKVLIIDEFLNEDTKKGYELLQEASVAHINILVLAG